MFSATRTYDSIQNRCFCLFERINECTEQRRKLERLSDVIQNYTQKRTCREFGSGEIYDLLFRVFTLYNVQTYMCRITRRLFDFTFTLFVLCLVQAYCFHLKFQKIYISWWLYVRNTHFSMQQQHIETDRFKIQIVFFSRSSYNSNGLFKMKVLMHLEFFLRRRLFFYWYLNLFRP